MIIADETHNSSSGNDSTPSRAENRDEKIDSAITPADQSKNRLPNMLRTLGVVTLLASVSVYLLQGWESGSDMSRYLMLWGHTLALTGVGLFCSRFLKEQKSARVLLMLTLVFIAADFAITGGFIFSIFGSGDAQVHSSIRWVMADKGVSIIALTAAGFALLPMVLLGFKVLVRPVAKEMSLLFLTGCVAMLVPVRDGIFASVILLGLVFTLIYGLLWRHKSTVQTKTYEGRVAKLLVVLPLGIILGRNFMHDTDAYSFSILAGSIWFLFRLAATELHQNSILRKWVEAGSIIPCLALALALTGIFSELVSTGMTVYCLLFFTLFSVLTLELSMRAACGRQFYSVMSVLSIAVATWLAGSELSAWSMSIYACIAGGGLILFGSWQHRQAPLQGGVLIVAVGVIATLVQLFGRFETNVWLMSTGLGISAIVAASYIEKKGYVIKNSLKARKQSIASWQY